MTLKEIQSIIKDFESSPLMTLELETEGFKLKLSKNKTNETIQNIQIQEPNKEKLNTDHRIKDEQKVIKSPLVGTFYASSTPQGKPFVEVGQHVKKGQVVCIVEAMKIMNEITSPYEGIIKEITVKNGDVIGFNHILMRIGDSHEK